MANWYLCEVIKAGSPLPRGTVQGKKVYCKRYNQEDKGLVNVLSLTNAFDTAHTMNRYAAKKCLKIIRRLNDGQSKRLDSLLLDAQYLARPKRAVTFKRR